MTGFTVAETWQSSISATHWQDVYIYIQFFSTKAAAFVIVTAMIGLLSPVPSTRATGNNFQVEQSSYSSCWK